MMNKMIGTPPPSNQPQQSTTPPAANMLGIGQQPIQPQGDPVSRLSSTLRSNGVDDHSAMQRLQWSVAMIGKLLSEDDPKRSDVISSLAEGVKDQVFTAKDAAALVPTIPEDGAQLSQWLKTNFVRSAQALQSIEPHAAIGADGKYHLGLNAAAIAAQQQAQHQAQQGVNGNLAAQGGGINNG